MTGRAPIALAAGLAAMASSCERALPPVAQVVLHVTTDAPLPPAPGEELEDDAPRPLFDRLRVDVVPPGSDAPCGECTREFAIDRRMVAADRASFAVTPPAGASGFRARVRLYRATALVLGQPHPAATIDTTLALPAVEEGAVTHVTAFLRTDTVAQAVGSLTAPVAAIEGVPPAGVVGTWPGARRVPCPGAPGEGEVCVPGGAFWMGDPTGHTEVGHEGTASDLPRLVVLSPYWLEAKELTVADARASGLVEVDASSGVATDPLAWSGDTDGAVIRDFCTYTVAPGPNDALPVTCLTWAKARAICLARGRDLPTEAELEHAAGGAAGRRYPWGEDAPSCEDAVFARGGVGLYAGAPSTCRPPTAPSLPEPAGTGARDRVALPGGTILDLAGNAAEWCLDLWNRQDEPCWGTGIRRDPRCDAPSAKDGTLRSTRGGSFPAPAGFLRTGVRFRAPSFAREPGLGVRCARRVGGEAR